MEQHEGGRCGGPIVDDCEGDGAWRRWSVPGDAHSERLCGPCAVAVAPAIAHDLLGAAWESDGRPWDPGALRDAHAVLSWWRDRA